MGYPVRADLEAYLQEQGMVPDPAPSDATLDRRLAAAVLAFERAVDWRPFLSTGTPETRTFHESFNGLVDLGGGLLSLISLTLGSTPFASGSDYRAEPFESDAITAIRLMRGGTGPLTVGGVWGRVAEVPPDVFEAILAKAALSFVPAIQGAIGAVRREKAGPVETEYDTTAGRATPAVLAASYEATVEAWRRTVVA